MNSSQILDFINLLEQTFKENAHQETANWQIQYMRNQFGAFGIPSPLRKELQKPFLDKNYLPQKAEALEIIKILWQKPEREFQYFGLALANAYIKKQEKEDINFYEWMILHKSWWDTVDYIAPDLVGKYMQKFPEERDDIMERWIKSGNIWLQRSTIIFQLKYKEKTDVEFLAQNIEKLLGSKEFFINKAIGWSLRQYSRYNPVWVSEYVRKTPELSGLSRREALRKIL